MIKRNAMMMMMMMMIIIIIIITKSCKGFDKEDDMLHA